MFGLKRGITVALGGGGSRGFAHVGVLEVLQRHGIRVEAVVGASAGALAGAGYALGHTADEIREKVMEFAGCELAVDNKVRTLVARDKAGGKKSWLGKVNRMVCQGQMVKALFLEDSVLGDDYLRQVVDFFLPDVNIESMPVPFATVATDVLTGEAVVLDSGPLRQAVLASCSIPGVAPPVKLGGRFLVDGGVVCLVPVDVAAQKWGWPVLGVGVDRDIVTDVLPSQALEYWLRAGDIQSVRLGRIMLEQADYSFSPQVGGYHWADFICAEEIMDEGARAAGEHLFGIKKLTRGVDWLSRMRRRMSAA